MKQALKNKHISDLIWTATKQGGFQRSHIYIKKEDGTVSPEERKALQKHIKVYCFENLYLRNKDSELKEPELLKLIRELCKKTESRFSAILKDRQFQFGNAQKFVNLYLKLMWIVGDTDSPPHFPVDRIIQRGFRSVKSWTNMNETQYLEVIREAESKRKKGQSLADWELETYDKIMSQRLS